MALSTSSGSICNMFLRTASRLLRECVELVAFTLTMWPRTCSHFPCCGNAGPPSTIEASAVVPRLLRLPCTYIMSRS